MKRILSFAFICVALIAAAACSDEIETKLIPVPSVTLSFSSVTLSSESVDSYTINYTVTNPVDGAAVYAAADASWVSDVDATVSGQIRFSVDENVSEEMRTTAVTLNYLYSGGSVIAKVAVVQYGAGGPVLSVDPNVVIVTVSGGRCSFDYEVANPIDGESVSCSTDAEWISDLNHDTYGTVSFTVAASGEEELRTGIITVTYAGLTKNVAVIQDHPVYGDSGDFDGSIDSLVGTYTAQGYAYYSSSTATYTTWTLTIYKSGDNEVIIDGLSPQCAGTYPQSEAFIAKASLNAAGQLVIPTQFTGYADSETKGHFCWTPCTAFDQISGWTHSTTGPDCTLTYNPSTGTWTSDYGEMLGECSTYGDLSNSSWLGFLDVTNPGFLISKTGSGGSPGEGDGDIIGTYLAEAYGVFSSGEGDGTWTMYIGERSSSEYYVACLTPTTGGLDLSTDLYDWMWATGYFRDENSFVIPSQICGGVIASSGAGWVWPGYTPCVGHSSDGFYYSPSFPDLVFTKTGDGSWESNYGVFFAGFSNNELAEFPVYFGVVAPTIKITRTSSYVPLALTSVGENPGREPEALNGYSSNFKVAIMPKYGTSSDICRIESKWKDGAVSVVR